MVIKFLIIAISLSSLLFGGEFTAAVSSMEVPLNENFSLSLTLKDTSPVNNPDINVLNKDFLIHSEHHSSQKTIFNGKTSSSITWNLSLTPKTEGQLQIPSISIETAEGPLFTKPLVINVVKGTSLGNISVHVSNLSPYKNEPIIYTATFSSKSPLYQVNAEKLQVEGAIVEVLEEPKVLNNTVEFTYLITPMKTGTLTIPSIAIQGAISQKGKKDEIDLFSLVRGVGRLKPITLMSEEMTFEVQPPAVDLSPWLPAKSLILEELPLSEHHFRVGEPFTRTFLIRAEGLKASQLPRLEDHHKSSFRLYADKPEEEEKIVQGSLKSTRKEHFTLIPSQAGTQVLPEITIAWWDSVNKEKRTAVIPARTLEILPAPTLQQPEPPLPSEPLQPPYFLYGVIGALSIALAISLIWGFSLKRKLNPKLPKVSVKKPTPKEKKEKLPDLNPT